MVLWFGAKKKQERLEQDIERLNKKLEHSFKNLDVDMKTVSNWISHLSDHRSHHDKRLQKLEKQMSEVLSLVDYHHDRLENIQIEKQEVQEQKTFKVVQEEPSVEEIEIKSFSPDKVLQELTESRKKLLLTLAALAVEMGNWVSMKSLTEEIYPSKKYSDVKSMVCDYTNNLYDLGLIEKKRKGREVYLGLTEKGKLLTKGMVQVERANKPKKKQ